MLKLHHPLAGLRVLELANDTLATPLCARMLAELGAYVTAVHIGPDRSTSRFSGVFEVASYAKQHARINVDDEEGLRSLRIMIEHADVLLLDHHCHRKIDSLRSVLKLGDHRALIVCCISPFGIIGPQADVPASEFTLQAIAGVLASNGDLEDPPTKTGVPIAAYGGATYGFISILAALYQRFSSGRGQFIDQSEFDALISFQGTLVPGHLLRGDKFGRLGNRHSSVAPWNTYRTTDGWVAISTVGDGQWRALASAMNRDELVDDARFRTTVDRVTNVELLDEEIEAWTSSLTSKSLLEKLQRVEVPASSILTTSEALDPLRFDSERVYGQGNKRFPRLPFVLQSSELCRSDEHALPKQWSDFQVSARPGAPESSAPLAGVRVAEVSILTSGPLAGRILGMLGAEVVKIESPAGERTRHVGNQIGGTSYLYRLNNTDKLGIAIDTREPEQQEALLKLCSTADVLLSNVSTASLVSMGISPEELQARHAQLICCLISGYGQTGTRQGQKTFDMVIQAETGIMSLTGPRDGRPTKIAMSIVDLMSALQAVAGTVAALIARTRFGCGQSVDVSLFDAGVWMTQTFWPQFFNENEPPRRMGNRSRHYAVQGCFRAADGWLAISVGHGEQWQAWLQLAGFANKCDFELNPTTSSDRIAEAERLVAQWAAGHAVDLLAANCATSGLAAAPVLTLEEAIEHPLTAARKMLVTVDTDSVGPLRLIGSPIKMSSYPVGIKKAAPELGANNHELALLLRSRVQAV